MPASEQLTPTIYNLTLTSANTEYSQALPAGVKHFTFQARSAADVRFAFVTGKVATPTAPYCTLKASSGFSAPEKFSDIPTGTTLYFATASAGTIMEIIAYA